MPLHLVRFASGVASLDDLRRRQARSSVAVKVKGRDRAVALAMRNRRRRAADFTDASSLYWVIDGAFAGRQVILAIRNEIDGAGRRGCTLLLDPALVPVDPRARRNFGGWRYAEDADVPADLAMASGDLAVMPGPMRHELRRLGVL